MTQRRIVYCAGLEGCLESEWGVVLLWGCWFILHSIAFEYYIIPCGSPKPETIALFCIDTGAMSSVNVTTVVRINPKYKFLVDGAYRFRRTRCDCDSSIFVDSNDDSKYNIVRLCNNPNPTLR